MLHLVVFLCARHLDMRLIRGGCVVTDTVRYSDMTRMAQSSSAYNGGYTRRTDSDYP
jgi:hypothetical protein